MRLFPTEFKQFTYESKLVPKQFLEFQIHALFIATCDIFMQIPFIVIKIIESIESLILRLNPEHWGFDLSDMQCNLVQIL